MAGGFVIVGRIKRAHGIRGELVVEPLTDEPDAVFASGRRVFAGDMRGDINVDPPVLNVRATRPFGDNMLVFVDEVSDRTQAELWQGRYLFLPGSEVSEPSEGEVFIHELPGMKVRAAADVGTEYGEVSATYELPQGLMLEVLQKNGSTAMLPFRTEMIVSVDRDLRVILVNVPAGLFDS